MMMQKLANILKWCNRAASLNSFMFSVCVVTGNAACEVTAASENELQCVVQSEEKTHIVTNQGFDRGSFMFLCFVQLSN